MDELKARNCEVTQATLSRDLKTLRTSKVVTEMGGYRYVIAANGTAADEVATHAMDSVRQAAILSLAFTGNIAVIKTRNGYAGGLAYDIDEISSPLLLGTIAEPTPCLWHWPKMHRATICSLFSPPYFLLM